MLYLRQVDLQAEVIVSQEKQKEELREIMKLEETLGEDYQNLTKINSANIVENNPTYVRAMVKTIEDQTEDINRLR